MQAASSPGRPILRSTPPTESRDGNALLVAERDGPEMLARIAVMKALNRHQATQTPAPRRKPEKVFRIVR
jgi:hypothetical protein